MKLKFSILAIIQVLIIAQYVTLYSRRWLPYREDHTWTGMLSRLHFHEKAIIFSHVHKFMRLIHTGYYCSKIWCWEFTKKLIWSFEVADDCTLLQNILACFTINKVCIPLVFIMVISSCVAYIKNWLIKVFTYQGSFLHPSQAKRKAYKAWN